MRAYQSVSTLNLNQIVNQCSKYEPLIDQYVRGLCKPADVPKALKAIALVGVLLCSLTSDVTTAKETGKDFARYVSSLLASDAKTNKHFVGTLGIRGNDEEDKKNAVLHDLAILFLKWVK